MAPVNNFLTFCPNDTGTNLLSESDYLAATDRAIGNQPGVASSKLNNKALRQSSFIISQVAQYLSDVTNTDVLDDAVPTRLLAQMVGALKPFAPNVTSLLSGSGTFIPTYIFQIASGSASSGATYTNNAITYTVVETVASGVILRANGVGAPTASGTLTKASGSGDASIVFYAVRAPLYLKVEAVGGGGGGAGTGTAAATDGGTGGNTTFGSALLSAGGGAGGNTTTGAGGAGGSSSLGSGPEGLAVSGGTGQSQGGAVTSYGGLGAASALGGSGTGGDNSAGAGGAGLTNTGGGGGGGGGNSTTVAPRGGGGSGGYISSTISSPSASYAYAVGAAGSAGGAGTSGAAGGTGGSGMIVVEEHYQ